MASAAFRTGFVLLIAMLTIAQLALGTSLLLVFILDLISLTALVPLSRRQFFVSDMLFLLFVVYYGVGSLVLKTLQGQPLQSNLHAPDDTALCLMVGFISISLGYVGCVALRRPSGLSTRLNIALANPDTLKRLAIPAFLVGAVFYFIHTRVRGAAVGGEIEDGGTGAFGSVYPLLLLGTTMQIALMVARPKMRIDKVVFGLMALTILMLTFADNTKKTSIDFMMIIITAIAAYGIRVRATWIVFGTAVAAVFALYIVPVVQIVRADEKNVHNRVATSIALMQSYGLDIEGLNAQADKVARGYVVSYSGSYFYPAASNSDRFAMIHSVDEIARSLDTVRTMGGSDILRDIAEAALPSAVLSKTSITTPDRIAWHYGFRVNGSIARPVVGLVASAIAAYGVVGAVVIPGIVIFFGFLLVDFLGGSVRRGAWGIFIFASCTLLAEKEVSTFISFYVRTYLILFAIGAVLLAVTDHLARARRRRIRDTRQLNALAAQGSA